MPRKPVRHDYRKVTFMAQNTRIRDYYDQDSLDQAGETISESDFDSAPTITNDLVVRGGSSDGGSNPFWKSEVKQHVNATTTFVASRDVANLGGGSIVVRYVGDPIGGGFNRDTTYTFKGTLPAGGSFIDSESSAVNAAMLANVAQVYRELSRRQTALQSGVIVAELRETLGMIRSPAKTLLNFITRKQFPRFKSSLRKAALKNRRRRGDAKDPGSLLKLASDHWLETQFGWKPFIMDIKSAMQAYQTVLDKVEYKPLRVKTHAMEEHNHERVPLGFVGFTYENEVSYRTEVKVLAFGETKNLAGGVRPLLGLTWGDFVPTVWEALPFSFLADYFLNIGDILNGAFVDLASVQRISYVRKVEGVCQYTFGNFRAGTGSVSGGHSVGRLSRKTVTRALDYPLSLPSLQFSFPKSPIRWGNMGALIASNYKGAARSHLRF